MSLKKGEMFFGVSEQAHMLRAVISSYLFEIKEDSKKREREKNIFVRIK